MSTKRTNKDRQKHAGSKKGRKAKGTQHEKAKAFGVEAIDRVGTVLFLEYFMPHYIEPSLFATLGVLGASILVFVVRVIRQLKDDV